MAAGLAQIPDQVNDLCHPAADHNPECKVYFQRDPSRISAFLVWNAVSDLMGTSEQPTDPEPTSNRRTPRQSWLWIVLTAVATVGRLCAIAWAGV
jgi:hypothetical protein